MIKSNDSQLKGTDDMMKELNKSQGRYIPVWMQPPVIKKTKTKETKDATRTRDIRVDKGKTTKIQEKETKIQQSTRTKQKTSKRKTTKQKG